MNASHLIREARLRADLSQAELAARAGTTQSAIARLESGGVAPSLDRVARLIEACGLELRVGIGPPPRTAIAAEPSVDTAVLEPLVREGVGFVIVGMTAAVLRGGTPPPSTSVAICPDDRRANLEGLCRVLEELGARLRTLDGIGTMPFDRTPEALLARDVSHLTTVSGDLDVSLRPPGTRGYRDLVRDASVVQGGGLELPTASLPDVIRELEAAATDPEYVHQLRRLDR